VEVAEPLRTISCERCELGTRSFETERSARVVPSVLGCPCNLRPYGTESREGNGGGGSSKLGEDHDGGRVLNCDMKSETTLDVDKNISTNALLCGLPLGSNKPREHASPLPRLHLVYQRLGGRGAMTGSRSRMPHHGYGEPPLSVRMNRNISPVS
jgi:hypothetical protein